MSDEVLGLANELANAMNAGSRPSEDGHREKCGHMANGNFGPLVCMKPTGHKGYHEQRDALRDGLCRTNWDDDGRAPWAGTR